MHYSETETHEMAFVPSVVKFPPPLFADAQTSSTREIDSADRALRGSVL